MSVRLHKLLLFLLLAFFISGNTQGQTSISGIINSYIKVNSVNTLCNAVTIGGTPTGFNNNDKVLLIQMKGAAVTSTNSSTFGTITAIGNAGNYEFNEILDIQPGIIYLKYTLVKTYDGVGLQLVTIPQYTDALITGTLTSKQWDGSTGGVLVFEASGNVEFNANINVEGLGFRGGAVSAGNSNSCGLGYGTNYAVATGSNGYAMKGESISEYIAGKELAYNPQANGGGGGHASNTGGGGGGNYGKGGQGGRQSWSHPGPGCLSTDGAQGKGGLTLSTYFPSEKIFMGGGGGGGQQNNYTAPGPGSFSPGATPGNPGGGIVIIKALTIIGNGFSIYAGGLNVKSLIRTALYGYSPITYSKRSMGDSGGGGGGGGSVLLSTSAYTNGLNVDVSGGRGDTVYTEVNIDLGPGGGGGGGVVWVKDATLDANISANLNKGVPGLSWNPSYPTSVCQCRFKADSGDVGTKLYNLVIPQATVPFSPCTTVPVSLISFTGKESYGKILLNWSTAMEANNDHFVLEKSEDGINYEYLTTLKGNGNSNSVIAYSYTDHFPFTGTNYYKLMQYDFDGKVHIDGHVLVRFAGAGEIIEKIYPNPFTNELVIEGLSSLNKEETEIKVFDVLGTEVYSLLTAYETQRVILNTTTLAKGVYLLKITNQGKIETRKIVKE